MADRHRRRAGGVGAAVGDARHGRLEAADAAPPGGEVTIPLVAAAGFTVEQILSGEVTGPVEYRQDHDEWVLLLEGAACLAVDGVAHDLVDGDWCFLPADVPHVLVRVAPGTRWLAVRGGDRAPAR